MPIQAKNEFKGNKASKRAVNARGWGMLARVKSEIAPPTENPLDEFVCPTKADLEKPARQANRRATDARATGRGNGDFYSHPEMGKPEVGIRMVSVQKPVDNGDED